ncbi:MAG: Trk system potassium transporter TrkA [Anaerovoracaceae bacterium]|nr:Trk system potassium transporter TrkA [Anaerovoracaceae bacterium]
MKVAIAGAGKLGHKIADALIGGDHDVTIIDKNEEKLQKLSSQLDVMTVTANAKQATTLQELHIGSYDFLIACTNDDEKNIVIASFAKNLGCSHVIARVRDPEHMRQIDFIRETMNIDLIINPDLLITNEIYKYLVEKYSLTNGIFSTGRSSLLEFRVSKMPHLIGLDMTDVNSVLSGMLVVAISRKGKVIIPHGNDVIRENDLLYVIGSRADIKELSKRVFEKGKYTDLQKVMIIGGGKTGLFLAQKLAEFNISVKLVERSRERCYYLAEHLDDVIILHGDGTDISLLEEENLDDMDALVTVTGFDEDNLLLALMAKNKGIDDVIAKVSRGIYADMISQLGVDMALNPQDIAVSQILRVIQGKKRIVSSQLIQGQAEIMEVIVDHRMKIVDRPLKKIDLPAGVLIAAIHRGQELIIPNGDTVIQYDDRVLIVCLLSDLVNLEKILRNTGKLDFLK